MQIQRLAVGGVAFDQRANMKVKRPNPVLYCAAFILVYPVLKLLFRLDDGRKHLDRPKGPFILIANHTTMIDFLLVMLPFYPRRINAVAAHKYFLNRPLSSLLPIMGAIPKKQFDPDIRSIKGIKSVLARGDSILLFPEGRCSIDGSFSGIHRSTGKLIKLLGVPVVSCYIEGAYTCAPHWRKGLRSGRVRVSFKNLFTPEDVKALSAEEINDAISARLSGADMPPPGKPLRTFKSRKLAEGLDQILYWCPKCGAELKLKSEGNSITCTLCGNSAEIDNIAKLTPTPGSVVPDSVPGWYREQTRYETRRLSEDMEPIVERVTLRMPKGKPGEGVAPCGTGLLRLDPKGWHYDGELSGEQVSLFFPVETVPVISFEYGSSFEIYSNGSFYMFTPDDTRKNMKYSLLGECAHRRFSSRLQMTAGENTGFYKGGC